MDQQQITSLFDRISWRDPISGLPLEPIVQARTPAGVPISGALKIAGTSNGYPIVDCVARLTPELAYKYRDWLTPLKLEPPTCQSFFQEESTVDSFGWQWTWNSNMRSDRDLQIRVAEKFQFKPDDFKGKVVLDAGAGAGDQSRYLLQQGAQVVSVDLSSAIEVVARKLRMNPCWMGVQGDVTSLPLKDEQFDVVYCEGVIQHTQDSSQTIRELCRLVKVDGYMLASHYVRTEVKSAYKRLKRKLTRGWYNFLRNRFSRMDRFKLLLMTGNLAAWSYIPILGWFFRRSGIAMYYKLMPDFKTTWTNTFDYYGNHTYQRFISPRTFWDYFEGIENIELTFKSTGIVVAHKIS